MSLAPVAVVFNCLATLPECSTLVAPSRHVDDPLVVTRGLDAAQAAEVLGEGA